MKTLLTALLVPLSVSAQIVSNGDFQTPDISPDSRLNLPAGEVFGWYVVFGDVDLVRRQSGQQVLDLNGFDTGAIQQTLDFQVDPQNNKYDLSFRWTPNIADAQASDTHVLAAVVNWNSQTLAVLTYDVDNDIESHERVVHLTVEGHGSDTLQFVSRNRGTGGIMIDNVSLLAGATSPLTPPVEDPGLNPPPVPEPSQYAAIAGLGLCAFAAWRKCHRKRNCG